MRLIYFKTRDNICAASIIYNFVRANRLVNKASIRIPFALALFDNDGKEIYPDVYIDVDYSKESCLAVYPLNDFILNENPKCLEGLVENELVIFIGFPLIQFNIDAAKQVLNNRARICWLDNHDISKDGVDQVETFVKENKLDRSAVLYYYFNYTDSMSKIVYDIFIQGSRIRQFIETDFRMLIRRGISTSMAKQKDPSCKTFIDFLDTYYFAYTGARRSWLSGEYRDFAIGLDIYESDTLESGRPKHEARIYTHLLIGAILEELEPFVGTMCNHCKNNDCANNKDSPFCSHYTVFSNKPCQHFSITEGDVYHRYYDFLSTLLDLLILQERHYAKENKYHDFTEAECSILECPTTTLQKYRTTICSKFGRIKDDICEKGKAIAKYTEDKFDHLYKRYGNRYSITIVNSEQPANSTSTVAAVINSSIGHSSALGDQAIFGEDSKRYPILISYKFDGEKYQYMIFSDHCFDLRNGNVPSYIPAGFIANLFLFNETDPNSISNPLRASSLLSLSDIDRFDWPCNIFEKSQRPDGYIVPANSKYKIFINILDENKQSE